MKKILLILLIFSCSETKKIKTDKYLTPYVNAFLLDADVAGVNTKTLTDSLNYIIHYPLTNRLLGLYHKDNKQVVISTFILNNEIVVRRVVYHELAHVLGLKHEDGGIMTSGKSPRDIYMMYNNPVGDAVWYFQKEMLFKQILKKQIR